MSAGTDDADFKALYSEHLDFVWRNLRALGVASADVEDAAQETFVVAYRRRADFLPDMSIRAWLYGVARRVAYRSRRGAGRRARLSDAIAAQPRERASLEEVAEIREAWQAALDVLDGLPAPQRVAYWLTEIEGLTAAQAGTALGVTGNTVSSRLRAARQSLARYREVFAARGAGELERALRRRTAPSASERRRVAGLVAARLATGSKVLAPTLGGAALWFGGGALVALVGVGAVVGLRSDGETPPAAPPSSTVRADPPAATPKRSIEAEKTPTAQLTKPAQSEAPQAAPSVPRRSSPPVDTRPTEAAPAANELAAEAKLLRQINTAVRTTPDRALVLLGEHARRFPRGTLADEANALRVQAQCALGREADAKRSASALPPAHGWALVASSGCPKKK